MSWRALISAQLVALVLGVGLGTWFCRKPAPAPSVQIAQHASRVAHAVTAQRETTYVHDTLKLSHAITKYDTARVTQTITHDSIVYVPRDVADSAVRACRDVANSCAALHAADSAEIHALHTEIAARDADRPSRLHRLAVDAAFLGAGYLAGRAGVGAHLSLRVPF